MSVLLKKKQRKKHHSANIIECSHWCQSSRLLELLNKYLISEDMMEKVLHYITDMHNSPALEQWNVNDFCNTTKPQGHSWTVSITLQQF